MPIFRFLLCCALMLVLIPLEARTIQGSPVTVEAPAGAVEGRARDGVEAYVGIPYAAPPVGPLRWRPPAPAPRWQGVRPSIAFGNDCPQQRLPGDATPSDQAMSEDCLTINVWRPARARRHLLPVMVWIHGGGFVMGSASSPVLDGAALARRGVVLVSFNYRLGRFGHFAHPALTREAGGRPSANLAFEDMIAALRWVRDNAGAFGGDPGNVTIFGESAGGAAVNFLMGAPTAEGLFHQAIVESGANREPYARLATDRPGRISAERAGIAFATHAGLANATADQLRALPADTVQGGLSLFDLQADRFTGPVIDDVTVSADPIDSFGGGLVPGIPYLIGTNSAELSEEPWAPVMIDLIRSQLGAEAMAALERAYGSPPDRALIDHYFFTEAARGYARIALARGIPAWLFVFDHVAEADRATRHGANHASELAYLFGNLPANAGPSDRETARLMGDYWVNFARTGNPNGRGLPAWPRFGPGDPQMRFGAEGASAERGRDAARLDAVEQAMASRPR